MKICGITESLQQISSNIERAAGQIATNYEIQDIVDFKIHSLEFIAVLKVARALSSLQEEVLKLLD
jgi:hypothetical protein